MVAVPRFSRSGVKQPHGHVVWLPLDGDPIMLDTWQCCHCGQHCIVEPGPGVRAKLAKIQIELGPVAVIKEPSRCWKCQRPVCDRRECQDHADAVAAGAVHSPLEGASGAGVTWGG